MPRGHANAQVQLRRLLSKREDARSEMHSPATYPSAAAGAASCNATLACGRGDCRFRRKTQFVKEAAMILQNEHSVKARSEAVGEHVRGKL